jgi:phospholipid/cholesterol/gamma-HCH transport system substrate-binding protein
MRNLGLLLRVLSVVLVGLLMAGGIVLAFGNFRFESTRTLHAAFTEVSGLKEGEDVRAAGVNIGIVRGLELNPDNTIRVTMSVADDVPVTTGSTASVRYKNLTGDHYLELAPGPGPRLAEDGDIPPSQTRPALDLDELFNGFTPLFQGLNTQQINELSGSLIQVFQGQGDGVQNLLASVGSLTNSLADRDQLIGRLVTNLNTVLDTANRRAPELSDLVVQLQTVLTRYAQQRAPLGEGIERVNVLAATVADFVPRVRPDLKGTIFQLDRVSGVVNNDSALLDDQLRRAPGYYNAIDRVGLYASAFNFYLCGVRLRIDGVMTPMIPDQTGGNGAPRCHF